MEPPPPIVDARFAPSFACPRCDDSVTMPSLPNIGRVGKITVQTAVHRFEETIGDRVYLIEAKAVDQHRWRAYIVRVPGVCTALMPFYGETPEAAAAQLCDWLARAHAKCARTTKAAAHA